MPIVKLDARFKKDDAGEEAYGQIKIQMATHFIERFGDKLDIKQEVITHGNPDGLGELTSDVVVIRTSAKVTLEEGLKIKKQLAAMDKNNKESK
jgi:hypothetical protein